MRPKVLATALMLACIGSSACASTFADAASFDCSNVQPGTESFMVSAVSSSDLTAADVQKLQRAVCRVARASSALEKDSAGRIRRIQVTPYVGSARLPLDAYLTPGSSTKAPQVSITTTFVEDATEDQLVAVLGHEVSHALNDDASEAAYARTRSGSQGAAGLGFVSGALGGKLVAASWAAGGVLGLVGAAALYAHTQCTQTYQVEKTADLYGARLLAQEGRPPEIAVQISASMVELLHSRNKPPGESFWDCYLPGSMAHPTAAARIRYLNDQVDHI